jgi:hypothetical protein
MATCPSLYDEGRAHNWRRTEWDCGGTPLEESERCRNDEIQVREREYPSGTDGKRCGWAWEKYKIRWCDKASNYTTDDTIVLWDCCTGKKSSYNCHPDYCQNSSKCQIFFENTCNGEILTNPNNQYFNTCNSLKQTNLKIYNTILSTYCNDSTKLGNAICQQYGIDNGGIDKAVLEYCRKNPTDDFCYFQTPLKNYTGTDPLLLNLNDPLCFGDIKKTPYGYKTTVQRNYTCPKQQICSNIINTGGVTKTFLSTIQASCSIAPSGASNEEASNKTGATTAVSSKSGAITGVSILELIKEYPLIFIFIIIVILSGGAYLYYNDYSIFGGTEFSSSSLY